MSADELKVNGPPEMLILEQSAAVVQQATLAAIINHH
jgi:hypothetical protein